MVFYIDGGVRGVCSRERLGLGVRFLFLGGLGRFK